MTEKVTANEIANELGLNQKHYRHVLRGEAFAWHQHNERWTVDRGSRQEREMRRVALEIADPRFKERGTRERSRSPILGPTTTEIEKTRRAFRPLRITTLFVGESPPASGKFFYYANSALARNMRRAMEEAFGPTDDFLTSFKGFGWYLDDLVLTPIDNLETAERIAACHAAQADLAARIAEYKPQAIVVMVLGIRDIVEKAAISVGSNAPRYAVPFPGPWHKELFLAEMKMLIPLLPRFSEPSPN